MHWILPNADSKESSSPDSKTMRDDGEYSPCYKEKGQKR